MMLTSLMDIFTVLVLYLLVNQGDGVNLEPPPWVVLPDSAVDTVPRQSIVISLTQKDILIQGEPVISIAEVNASPDAEIDAIRERILNAAYDAFMSLGYGGTSTARIARSQFAAAFGNVSAVIVTAKLFDYHRIAHSPKVGVLYIVLHREERAAGHDALARRVAVRNQLAGRVALGNHRTDEDNIGPCHIAFTEPPRVDVHQPLGPFLWQHRCDGHQAQRWQGYFLVNKLQGVLEAAERLRKLRI